MVQVPYRNSYEKVLKRGVDPPCAQTGVKSSLGTYVLKQPKNTKFRESSTEFRKLPTHIHIPPDWLPESHFEGTLQQPHA